MIADQENEARKGKSDNFTKSGLRPLKYQKGSKNSTIFSKS